MIRVGEGRVRTKAMDGDAVELAKFMSAQYGNLRLNCSLERVPAALCDSGPHVHLSTLQASTQIH